MVDVRPYKRLQHLCPQCGKNCPGYDRGGRPARTWRALDWGDVLVYLRYAPPRIQCPEHGVVTASVPWAYPGAHCPSYAHRLGNRPPVRRACQ